MRRADPAPPAALAHQLARLLVGTSAVRVANAERIAALAGSVDWQALERVCREHRLLALVGARVEEACRGAAPEPFRQAVADQTHRTRLVALVHRHALDKAHAALEGAGVPAMSLKGVAFAEALW